MVSQCLRKEKVDGSNIWTALGTQVAAYLSSEDDHAAWETIASIVFSDAEALLLNLGSSVDVRTRFGRCSHWLRPHQTRWTADGGFAWPSGYCGQGFSRFGTPEFDWFLEARWDPKSKCWLSVKPRPERRRTLLFRVAVPSRTARHDQAAVHTIWRPGPPQHRRKELLQVYGFRKQDGAWRATAYEALPDESAYESTEPPQKKALQ